MGWTWAVLLTVLFNYALSSQVSVIMKNGEFNFPFVVDEDIRLSSGHTIMYVSTSHRCVRSFVIETTKPAEATVTIERVSGNVENEWTFSEVGVGALTHTSTTIQLTASPVCASSWRLTISSTETTFERISIVHEPLPIQGKGKRTTTCDATAGGYPPECSSASEGAKCLSGGICGCAVDKDCFGNTDFPFCKITTGTTGECERCGTLSTPTGPNLGHLACLPRYPGLATHPSTGDPLPLERAAPANYFREFCVSNTQDAGGACQRCNQATTVPIVIPGASQASNQGASGTAHCNLIYTNKPICMDQTYMNDTGGNYDVNLRGACQPCARNLECARALPRTPICNLQSPPTGNCVKCTANAQCSSPIGGTNCQADGSCKSCKSDADCGVLDGGEKATQPSCNVATGICGDPFRCTTNPSCSGQGGNNCQASGACLTCTSNVNCGALDGGEIPGQPVCNAGSGLCGPCTTNAGCVGTGGNNCQASGACLTCTSGATCGTLDGGETPGQTICNTATGICESPCNNNHDCSLGTRGLNCQADGTCFTCRTDADCGPLDGGETKGQTKCDSTGLCTTPFQCTTNPSCVGNGGNNCQASGTCISCTPNTCGSLDGGESPGQPNCNTNSRLCVDACTTNTGCVGTQGNNCMKGGLCVTCKTNTDCSNDGGEVPNQIICNAATGICEDPCRANIDCATKSGKNCMASGACVTCASNVDCTNDGGEVPKQTECNTATGICQDPFKCTTNPSCTANNQAGKNCQKDLSCKTCKTNNDCGALDGGEIPGQPICNVPTGLCDFCTSNNDCPTGAKNCGADGLCYACSNAAGGKGCGVLDGPPKGPNNNQPNCEQTSGVCVDGCTLDSHCTADRCKPFCNVNKGCCQECFLDRHCPGAQWSDATKAALTKCSSTSGTCIKGCATDGDCSGATPACAASIGTCVACVYSSHCTGDNKFCHPTLLECTSEDGWGSSGIDGVAGIVIGSIALFLVVVVVVVLILTKSGGGAERF